MMRTLSSWCPQRLHYMAWMCASEPSTRGLLTRKVLFKTVTGMNIGRKNAFKSRTKMILTDSDFQTVKNRHRLTLDSSILTID